MSYVLHVTHYTLVRQRVYSLSKTPSRFFENKGILYYSYVVIFHFLHRN